MTLFEIAALTLFLTALGGYLNSQFIGLPSTIGHMTFALAISTFISILGFAGIINLGSVKSLINSLNFSELLLHSMLAFLLFAGALHIHLDDLKNYKYTVALLATFGVALATFITGSLTYVAASFLGFDLPYIYALIFGALISPTDPIAVLGILKKLGVPKSLYTKIGGESLFNDGVGFVVFLALLGVEASGGFDTGEFTGFLLWESLGGIFLGIALGWITYKLLCSIDAYKVEIMLTLALVAGGYAVAEILHVSGPLCMAAAGLIIGTRGRAHGMSEITRHNIDIFWELLDEILTAVLFLYIGLEIIIIEWTADLVVLAVMIIPAVLIARFISISIPISVIRLRRTFDKGTIPLLTWGGLRGGISIAMALSLPESPEKPIIMALTYAVVLFTIFGQGLTFPRLAARVMKPNATNT